MNVDEAKEKILREWDRWIGRQPNAKDPFGRDGLRFFFELQAKRSLLLDFPSGSVDKWIIIHGWLLATGRVRD
jgi:hypothetical protein